MKLIVWLFSDSVITFCNLDIRSISAYFTFGSHYVLSRKNICLMMCIQMWHSILYVRPADIISINWLSLRRLVSWINHLPPACWSTFWKSNFKQQLGCRFDTMDNISYFFVFWHMQLYVFIHQIIFRFYLLKYSFFLSTLLLTSSIDVVFIRSILMERIQVQIQTSLFDIILQN